MLLGWLNFIGLCALAAAWTARREKAQQIPRCEQPLVWFVFIWFALILTGHVLTIFGELNNPVLYCGVSLLMLSGAMWSFARLAPVNSVPRPVWDAPALPFYSFGNPKTEKYLGRALLALLAVAAACSLILVLHNYAGNADSVSYRLPRAFWYVSHGGFLHPFDAFDRRTIFYPLNGTALYVPLVVYGLPGTFHNAPTYIAWLAIALVCYRFARTLGAGRTIALLATALAALTPNVLVQAAATNDEILAGGALLLAVYFLFRWLQADQNIYLLLGVCAAGIGIGTKLHVVFYLPVLAVALAMMIYGAWRHPQTAKRIGRCAGWRGAAASLALLAVTILPFLVYNKISSGKFYFADEFADAFFNTRGKLHVALQNTLIYFAQMFVAPVADLYGAPDGDDRFAFHNALNDFFRPLIQPFLSADRADYHLQYKFTGVTLPVSPAYLEYSLWAGFIYLIAPFAWIQIAWTKALPWRGWWMLLALSPFIWMLTWCASTLYMEGTPTYLAYYLIVAAPALAFAFLKIDRAWLNRLRWAVAGFVLVTHIVIDANTYLYNEFRNVPRLMTSARLPYDWELMEQSVIGELEAAKKIRIVFTRWGLSYFGFMHHNPHAFYYGPHEAVPDPEQTLVVYAAPGAQHWGFAPVYVPHKPTSGLSFIGKMRGWSNEGVFALGNGVERRWPDRNRYLLFFVKASVGEGKLFVDFSETLPGLNADDRLEFRYEIIDRGQTLASRDWDRSPVWRISVPDSYHGMDYMVRIAVRVPGHAEPDVTYDLDLGGVREWTADMIGARP
ncbi:MAG: glycosyltransferase family 39 protein [Alphaproteobacteria bacterium]